jgi:hypothetical protein
MIDSILTGAGLSAMPIGNKETLQDRNRSRHVEIRGEIGGKHRRDTAISCQWLGAGRIAISPTPIFMVFSSDATRLTTRAAGERMAIAGAVR